MDIFSAKKEKLNAIWQKSLATSSSQSASQEVNALKGISEYPHIDESQRENYYAEPVTIEYYVSKESRFANEIKYLFLELIDPQPTNKNQEMIFHYFRQKSQPIDILHALDIFPQFMKTTLEYYCQRMQIFESLSRMYRDGLNGRFEEIKKSIYTNELFRKWEPSVPALKIFGNFPLFNINWAIRFLNNKKIAHELEDDTVSYFIHLNEQKMKNENKTDKRFALLSRIYREQAFPHASPDEQESLIPVFIK